MVQNTRYPYFNPFDITYGEVARRTRLYLNDLSESWERFWLSNLIWYFQVESDSWDLKEELEEYRNKMKRLQLRVLQLSAAAYLHIAYDLPRVLAYMWRAAGIEEDVRKADIYDDIGKIFPEVIHDMAGRRDVVGNMSIGLRSTPLALAAIEHWIGNLRKAAWSHARQLQGMSAAVRASRESSILQAVTAAFVDTSNWKPWSPLYLAPPQLPMPSYSNKGAYVSVWLFGVADVMQNIRPIIDILNIAALLAGVGSIWFVYRAQSSLKNEMRRFNNREAERELKAFEKEEVYDEEMDREITLFVDHLGRRVQKYVAFVMENPEGFPRFRAAYNVPGGDGRN